MFLTEKSLKEFGFKHIGKNVLISDKASIYNPKNISIGDNVRIDDFCILSAGAGGIHLGNYVHIACYASLIGQGAILVEDFCGISSKVSIYSSTDDYGGDYLTGPLIKPEYLNVISGTVELKKHVIIGASSVLLPNITLHEGVAVAALSLVNKSFDEFLIIGGVPAKILKPRSRKLLALEQQFLATENKPKLD